MNKKLITIAILSYNNIEYYKECIDSVLIQNYENIELIFSDDGSKDFNLSEIEEYIEKNKGQNIVNVIINYNDENIGTVKNANKAIGLSKGDYIQLLAVDDCLYEESTLSKVVEYLDKTKALISVGYVDKYNKEMTKKIRKCPSEQYVSILKRFDPKEMHKFLCIGSSNFLPAPARTYSRNFFEEYGLFDEDYILLEDKPLLAKAIRNRCKIHFIDETIAKYRDGGVSGTGLTNPLLKKDLETFNQKESFPFWGIALKDCDKDIVIWGTSSKYLYKREELSNIGFKYFVDSDISKQDKELDTRMVYSPNKLLDENKDSIMIVVCSSFYVEISEWLNKHGYKENINYMNINFVSDI